jgi:O-methyltransferase
MPALKTEVEIAALPELYPPVSGMVAKEHVLAVLNELYEILLLGVPGSIVEVGCNIGTVSLYISRVLSMCDKRPFHVYDSFEGMPASTVEDGTLDSRFIEGMCRATVTDFMYNYSNAHLSPPTVHKGLLQEAEYPEQVAFAVVDVDLYRGTKDALALLYPRMSSRGVIMVHDYLNPDLPGVERAVGEFLHSVEEEVFYGSGYAVLVKE